MQAPTIRPINPFSSQRTLPGAIPYLWPGDKPWLADPESALPSDASSPAGQTVPDDRFKQLADQILGTQRAAIRGPHGSGKSTLVASLIPHLYERLEKNRVRHWVLHNDCLQRDWLRQIRQLVLTIPCPPSPPTSHLPNGLLIVDGYEQLNWYGRQILARLQKKIEWNLLITTHEPVRGFENLLTTIPDRETAEHLLAFLLHSYPECQNVILQSFPGAWVRSAGDIRQLWSLLYDSYESYLSVVAQRSPGND